MTKIKTNEAFGSKTGESRLSLDESFPHLGEVKTSTPYAMRVRRPLVWKVERVERPTGEKKVTLGQANDLDVTFFHLPLAA